MSGSCENGEQMSCPNCERYRKALEQIISLTRHRPGDCYSTWHIADCVLTAPIQPFDPDTRIYKTTVQDWLDLKQRAERAEARVKEFEIEERNADAQREVLDAIHKQIGAPDLAEGVKQLRERAERAEAAFKTRGLGRLGLFEAARAMPSSVLVSATPPKAPAPSAEPPKCVHDKPTCDTCEALWRTEALKMLDRRIAQAVAEEKAKRDAAYAERNQCVAAMAKLAIGLGLDVGVSEHPVEDKEWEADWRTLLFIELPTGQVTWHFHDSEKHLLSELPRRTFVWDGHDTPEKYRRVNALAAAIRKGAP